MMTVETMTFIFSLLILAILADLGLLRLMGRRVDHRGAHTEDRIYILGSYSPILSWLKKYWKSLSNRIQSTKQTEADLKRQPSESHLETSYQTSMVNISSSISPHNTDGNQLMIQQPIEQPHKAALNSELTANPPQNIMSYSSCLDTAHNQDEVAPAEISGTVPLQTDEVSLESLFPSINLRQDVFPIFFLGTVLFLALTPAALVFRHRWLGQEYIQTPFNELWNQIWRGTNIGLPPYFAAIILSALTLMAILLLSKESPVFERDQAMSLSKRIRPPAIAARTIPGLRIMISALLICCATFVLGRLSSDLTGWGFLAALLLYCWSWIYREISLGQVLGFFQRNWEVLTASLLAHLALIYLIKSTNSTWETNRASIYLFLLALINLLRYFRRIPTIYWVVNLALALFTVQINSWAYSVVGDEYIFFERGQEIATQYNISLVVQNLFNGKLVYGAHPFVSSLIQGISMKLFGVDSFGWRFSSLYLSAIGIGFFYIFYKTFLPNRTAIIAAFLLASSSYLMSFGKIGYNNLQAFFALSLVLACCSWAIRSGRQLAFAALGLSMGFCLYVYPAAIYAIAPAVLLLLFYFTPVSRERLIGWGIVLISFSILFVPLLLQPDYWQAKLPGLWLNNPEITDNLYDTVFHVLSNLLLSLVSFLYIVEETHFVVVGYMDPLSAALTVLGFALTIKRIRQERFTAFLALSFFVMLFLVGVSHDRLFPPTTRMFMLLPWFAVFAAMGLVWLVEKIENIRFVSIRPSTLTNLLLVVIMGLNLYQAYPLSRQRSNGLQHIEVLFIRLVQERLVDYDPFSTKPKTFVFITNPDWGIDGILLQGRVYNYPATRLNLERLIVENPSLPTSELDRLQDLDTLVILQPDFDQEWQDALATQLLELGKEPCPVYEYTNNSVRFTMYLSPDRRAICPSVY